MFLNFIEFYKLYIQSEEFIFSSEKHRKFELILIV